MLPAIVIFGIKIPMYGLMVFCGIVAYVVTYFLYVEKGEHLDKRTSNRLLLVSLAGLAALYIFALLFDSLYHSIENGSFVFGSITWLGGVLGALPIMLVLIHAIVPAAKGKSLYYLSLLVPGIVIGHAFGRLGCFCGGCCYGAPTDGPFGISFPAGSLAAKAQGTTGASAPVLPTQLFEAAFEFCLFLLMVIGRKDLKQYNLLMYLFGYGVFRFTLEFWRDDDRGALVLMSPSQWNSLILIAGGIVIILFQKNIIFKKLYAKLPAWQEAAAASLERYARYDEAKAAIDKQFKESLESKTPVAGEDYDEGAPPETETEPVESVEPERPPEQSEAQKLRELKALFDDGLVTEEEFNSKREEILKRM